VEAFKATLEEAVVADFLVHVLDATSPEIEEHRETTMNVLRELGADAKRIITVYNKADLLTSANGDGLLSNGNIRSDDGVYVSAVTGQGLDELRQRMEEMIGDRQRACELLVPHERYDVIGKLHAAGCVKSERVEDAGVRLVCNLPERLQGLTKEFAV
jgi:GTP-binding protein HflX